MKKEIQKWLKQTKADLNTAEYLFKGKRYREAAFFCQQAAEKGLKTILLKRTGKIRKIHDLVQLGKDVGLPEQLQHKVKELTFAYIYSRYPDVKQERRAALKGKVIEFLSIVKEVLRWVESNL